MRESVVIDTNILISFILFKKSVPRKAFEKAYNEFIIVTSEECFKELKDVIFRPKFEKYISKNDAREFLKYFLKHSELIEINHKVTICRDPKDNKFLELAESSNSKFLISGDNDLLVLEKFNDIQILNPSQFINV